MDEVGVTSRGPGLAALAIAALATFFSAVAALAGSPDDRPLTFLVTSGLGGQLVDAEGRTVAAVAGTVTDEAARARAEGRDVVVLDLGRTVAPFAESRWDGGATMLAALRAAGCDAWVPDPMDFSLGLDRLRELAASGGVSVLLPERVAAAVEGSGFERTVEIDLGGGLRVRVRSLFADGHEGDLRAAGVETKAPQTPVDLGSDEAVDVVVVHSSGTGRETLSRRLTWHLMDHPRGADLLLDPDMGHGLEARSRTADGPVVLVGRDREASGWTVARIDVRAVRAEDGSWSLGRAETRVLPVEPSAPGDQRLALRARETLFRFHRENDVPLAESGPRSYEELRRFALRAMREATRAEVAVLNRGALRPVAERFFADGRPTGEAVLRMLSIDQRLHVVELTGDELKDLAEEAARRVRADGTPRADALEFLGLDAELSGARTPDAVVESAEVNGRPLAAAESYRVVTNGYLLDGGDAYDILAGREGELREETAPELRGDVVVPRLERARFPFADLARRSLWRYGLDRLSLLASGVETRRDEAYEASTDSRARASDSTHVATRLALYGDLDRTRWRWENRLDARFGLVEIEGATEEVDDDLRFESSLVFPKTRLLGGSPYASLLVDTELRHEGGAGTSRQLEESLSAGISWSTSLWPRIRLGVVGRHYSGVEREAQLGLRGQAELHWAPEGRRPGLDLSLLAERLQVDDSRVERLDLQVELLIPVVRDLTFTPTLDVYLFDDSEFPGSARYTRLSLGLSYLWRGKLQSWGPRPGVNPRARSGR